MASNMAVEAAVRQIQEQQAAFTQNLHLLIQTNHADLQKTVAQLLSHIDPCNDRADEKLLDPAGFKAHVDLQEAQESKSAEELGFSATYVEHSHVESDTSSEDGTKRLQAAHWDDLTRLQQFRRVVTRIVNSTAFELGVSLVIVLNLITIGIQAELDLNSAQLPWMATIERSFLFVYTVEVALRFVAKGPRIFCNLWFLLDFFLVLTGMFFLVAAPLVNYDTRDWDKILVIRGLRLLRLARVLRLLGQFKDVWRLVYGIVNSSLTIVSSAVLAFLMLYIFGCMAIEFITKDEKLASIGDEGSGNVGEIVAQNFGSLPRAILTLLQFMTMDSIAGIYFPLIMAKPVLFFFFAPILWLMGVALMNLVAAIFVENALQLAEEEADLQSNRKKQKAKDALPQLLAAFQRLNLDSSGRLTEEEFARLPTEVIPAKELKKFSVTDMAQLFQLLDVDGRGSLAQSELVDSLLDFIVLDVPMWSLKSLRLLRMINNRVAKIEGDVDRINQAAFDAMMM
eukprot:s441_g3.t1